MRLIGITGYAGSGKDTVGRLMTAHYDFKCAAIADTIRRFITTQAKALQRRVDEVGWDTAKADPTIRRLLETTGDAFRKTFPNLLLDTVLPPWRCGNWEHAVSRHGMPPYYAITDVRHEAEAHRVREWGGELWFVSRPDAPLIHDGDDNIDSLRPICTHFVDNGGTLADLECKVIDLL